MVAPLFMREEIASPNSFPVLDLRAIRNFRTSSSVSYSLERGSVENRTLRRLGWLDVHYPCDGPIRTQIRVGITEEYFVADRMNDLVATVLRHLELPDSEPYEADFVFQPLSVV